jgi:hypothetical protein
MTGDCEACSPCAVFLVQDVADFEWVMWFSTFRNHILFALTGHVIFAKIFSLLVPKVGVLCVCMYVRMYAFM